MPGPTGLASLPRMNHLLFAVGSLADLRRIAPLLHETKTAGLAHRIVWLGEAPTLPPGLPQPDAVVAAAAPAAALAAAEAECGARPPAIVLTMGESLAAFAFGSAATNAGLPAARLDAGRRHSDRHDRDRQLRALDGSASLWFTATAAQTLNLVREGAPMDRVHTVGSTFVPSGRPATKTVLSFRSAPDDAVTAAAAAAAAAAGMALQPERSGDPAAVEGAAAVLTDRDEVAEAALAFGVPCVTTTPSTRVPEAVDAGANHVAGHDPAAVARALTIALTGRRPAPAPAPAAAKAIAKALHEHLARPAAASPATPPAAPSLPSDGDWTGRTLGYEECELAARAIRSGTLNSTKGTFVARFEQEFAAMTGRKHAIACASGSAAVHCAIAALKLAPGDEVVTTPITDMGALTCISYEGAVPVFADVDPKTINVTADTIRQRLTDRTRAIVVTHLFGLPCDMTPIVALAREKGLPILEDVAQAFGAVERTGSVGTFGALACYSLQQGKHMTTGEGGVVTTDDPELARRVFLFVNKAWGYGDPKPDHYFPALNYRLTELQGAVALAQLRKLDWVVTRRREVAAQLAAGLREVAGLTLPEDPPGGRHSWWKYSFMVDPELIEGGAPELGKRMKARGVFCVPRYIQKPAFECQLYQDFGASPVTALPLEHNPRRTQGQPLFHRRDYPGTVRALDRVIVLPINELYTKQHVDYVTTVIREESQVLIHG